MNLQTNISDSLWQAVCTSYTSENYKHAILDAVHYVTGEIRDRTGIDGDGTALVSQALGGDHPKLRVNSLTSVSERDVQKGIEHLMRGLYLGIRNHRSHEQIIETKHDADAIIHFVDYVARVINASRESFTIENFLMSLSDTEFVESERYAELLVSEIPVNRRVDALIAIFENRLTLNLQKLHFLTKQLLALLNDAQLEQYLSIVSVALRAASEEADIRTTLRLLKPEMWPRIHETSRLRIENRLIREIKSGQFIHNNKIVGTLGTWAYPYIKYFSHRTDAASALLDKLNDTFDDAGKNYVVKYFLARFPEYFIAEAEIRRAIRIIVALVRQDDYSVRSVLVSNIRNFPGEWQTQIAESLQDLTDPENPAVFLDDGTPFLDKPTAQEEDDIPF